MDANGCVCVLWYTIIVTIGKLDPWGAWACMIWVPGWPGKFLKHHVRIYLSEKKLKRATSTHRMRQGQHKSLI